MTSPSTASATISPFDSKSRDDRIQGLLTLKSLVLTGPSGHEGHANSLVEYRQG
jgi:hypothetical protein